MVVLNEALVRSKTKVKKLEEVRSKELLCYLALSHHA